MLKLKDSNNTLIKQWDKDNPEHLENVSKTIIFTVHNSELLNYVEGKKFITVCYGFLDQEIDNLSTASYIAQQINRHGIDALNYCYGSFIIIHYDKINDRFIVANDALGDFAVHYTTGDTDINLSDLPQALLNKNTATINTGRLLHYFALTQPQNNGSFFQDIKQLNPGCYLTISKQDIILGKYYDAPTKINFKVKSLKKLSEKFKSLMQTVIKFQTKGQSKVGLMMSGGMDSTFVATNCLLADKQLSTFSYVFPHMPEADESLWINAMRSLDIDMHTFSGEPHWPLKSPWHISLNAPICNPYRHLKTVIYQQAQNKGLKIVLSGVFADHLYTGYIYWLVDQIKKKPLTAIKSLYNTGRQDGIMTCIRQVAPAKWSSKIKHSAPWLNKKTRQLHSNKQQRNLPIKHPHPQQYALAFGIATAQSNWLDNEYAFKHNLTIRHPFRDRRIVEFLMSVPAWILGTHKQAKKFVQTTAIGLLPTTIIRRNKTTTLKPVFIKGVIDKEIHKVRELLSGSHCEWQKYISEDLINGILANPQKQYKDCDYMILWQCIGFELWHKRLRNL